MIVIEELHGFPDEVWTERSQAELDISVASYRDDLLKKSYRKALISSREGVVAACGLYRQTFLGPAFFWALVTPRIVKVLRQLSRIQFGPCQTFINIDDPKAVRLARLFGFEPTGDRLVYNDFVYEIYGRS